MKKLIKILIIFAFLACSAGALRSQTISMTRSDTDTLRKRFITAGYMFGVDINVDSIKNCNRVIFELRYTHPELVSFSSWSAFYTDEEKFMVVNPQSEIAGGYGSVYVAVIIGENRLSKGIDDPRAIHLDFVVSQAATHNTAVTFDFIKPFAIVVNNNIDSNVVLQSENTTMTVHGYVDVWPGDADNNGTVNNEDFTQIVKLLGYGFDTKKTKCFKRRSASSLWKAQPVLAWDSIVASHADTDGNGFITVDDCLIVFLNFKKTKSAKLLPEPEGEFPRSEPVLPNSPFVRKIPLFIDAEKSYIAVAGSLKLSDDRARILGLEKGGQFVSGGDLYYKVKDDCQSVEFTLGNTDDASIISPSGEQLFLLCESVTEPVFQTDLKAIAPNGEVFPIGVFTSAQDEQQRANAFAICANPEMLTVSTNSDDEFSVRIFNSLGECIHTVFNCSVTTSVALGGMPSGSYFAECSTSKVREVLPFRVIH